MNRPRLAAALVLASLGAAPALAGPLNPPPGPITSTAKPLAEVEPRIAVNATNTPGTNTAVFRISQPGSYYLTGNVAGVSGKNGIEIAANGVTLDLNGFDLVGVPGSLDGVATATSSLTNITIANGSVRGWTGDGIDFSSNFSYSTTVRGVQSSNNAGAGFRAGLGFNLDRCIARANGTGGFAGGAQGFITHCEAYSNTGSGISAGQAVSVIGCASLNNTGTADGISIGGFGGGVYDCTVAGNGGNGIVVTVGLGTTVSGCSVEGSTLAGIQVGQGAAISNCSVNFSQTFNIIAGDECTVDNCTVGLGNLGGIQCASRCLVRGNACNRNANGSGTGPNILVTGTNNRIEGNNCTAAFRGIKVTAVGNFVTRNTCSSNSQNYDLVAGNACLVVSATTSAAILGSSGGVSPGSADPNANFSY